MSFDYVCGCRCTVGILSVYWTSFEFKGYIMKIVKNTKISQNTMSLDKWPKKVSASPVISYVLSKKGELISL